MTRAITKLPQLPSSAAWCAPKRTKLPFARFLHVRHRAVELTLCGRVRPGAEVTDLTPEHEFCSRCLYRACALWIVSPGV